MPAGTGDVAFILTLPCLLVGGVFAAGAKMFGAPEWGIWLAGIIGAVICLVLISKWIPHEDG